MAKVIGLTGSFGTGKTFAASLFKRLGAKVIDADKVAHDLIAKGTPAYKRILETFGNDILDRRGNIDRSKLAGIVFAQKSKLKKLNSIVHPGVIKFIKDRIVRSRKGDVIVIDAPLLVEAGLAGIVDKLVVVAASEEKQVKRCRKKFKMSKGDVLKRIVNQMSLNKKKAVADFVIDNDGTRSETGRQVRKVWEEIVWK